MKRRKGIYQSFDASGAIVSDERWQLYLPDYPAADGALWQIEAEITRIDPFPEPRVESLSAQLIGLRGRPFWRSFVIYTSNGQREAGVQFENNLAQVCWRHRREIYQRAYNWQTNCEIGYNSALLATVSFWRNRLRAGETHIIATLRLDAVTFEPRQTEERWHLHKFEMRETAFGHVRLAHYEFGLLHSAATGRMWCDEDGVIYEYTAGDGSGCRLIAANVA